MSDLAIPAWKWEDQPDAFLSDFCANGSCERCNGAACDHPCHCDHCRHDEPCYTHFPPPQGIKERKD